jgi:hypothetical protein
MGRRTVDANRNAASEPGSVRREIEKILIWWCYSNHRSVGWPIHSMYQCRTCGRRYIVPWALPGSGARAFHRSLRATEPERMTSSEKRQAVAIAPQSQANQSP